MKIALFYDSLVSKGGAERVAIELANNLGADIITSGYDAKINQWMPIKNRVIDIENFSVHFLKPLGILFEAPIRFFLNKNRFHYDINIYVGFSSIFGSKRGIKNIWYCLTPNKLFYDDKSVRIKKLNIFKQIILWLYRLVFKSFDQLIIKQNFTATIAQTKCVAQRINRIYKIKAKVIYSPVDTKRFKFNEFGDYFLSVGRLYPEKRIDLIAKAFTKMPTKKLIIVGDGPMRSNILNIIRGNSNIKWQGSISERELFNLYSNCLATIYIPLHEDFGLVPLEGMASGKTCIATNEGGCKETVIDGKTGFLTKATEEDIIKTVKKFNIKKARKMKNDCLKWVKRFDTKECIKQWKKEIEGLKII